MAIDYGCHYTDLKFVRLLIIIIKCKGILIL